MITIFKVKNHGENQYKKNPESGMDFENQKTSK